MCWIGPSGAGKSTVASLLMRLYDPSEGAITIDGVDLRDITLRSLGQLISVVPQEAFLLNDTVKQNLLLAKPSATEDELLHACKVRADICLLYSYNFPQLANFTEVLNKLKHGLET